MIKWRPLEELGNSGEKEREARVRKHRGPVEYLDPEVASKKVDDIMGDVDKILNQYSTDNTVQYYAMIGANFDRSGERGFTCAEVGRITLNAATVLILSTFDRIPDDKKDKLIELLSEAHRTGRKASDIIKSMRKEEP